VVEVEEGHHHVVLSLNEAQASQEEVARRQHHNLAVEDLCHQMITMKNPWMNLILEDSLEKRK